jgi:hypothetical protein
MRARGGEMTLFDLSKPGAKAIRSTFGGGWIVSDEPEAVRILTEYYGEGPTPIAPLGGRLGWIVEPQGAGDLAEYLRSEGIAWEVE